ncbi:saccharopine dehydrogenase NADP-binding domain-containing protein [Candidatus Woesearchaeota archaeon]|nr:saccharopine dehydrogenase NADP-binding domain-containing protein [Candidatus Woesearchaeota archaeon]
MHILLLGCGAQGKACLYDLLHNKEVKRITVVENSIEQVAGFLEKYDDPRIIHLGVDANRRPDMLKLMREADIVIDLLPTMFRQHIAELAIEAKTHLVNTSFLSHIETLSNAAAKAGIIIMPESGLDPGIDLVLAGSAVRRMDEVHRFASACGGIPTREACNNPIKYKISWIFEGVLSAYKRPADIIRKSQILDIPGERIFEYSEEVDYDGLGRFDRYPNGKASTYAKLLGISDTVQDMGRYTLRWPGHSDFWQKIVGLGLLDDEPVNGISPRLFMAKVLEPKLQYKDTEQDMIILRNEISGVRDGKKVTIIQQVVDKRDLKTGFMAMNRTVGFTASIIAQMILDGRIKGKGIMNPAMDVPCSEFKRELRERGIDVDEREN